MFEGLDPKIMLMTAIVFILMLFVLNNILYKPMLNFIKNRENDIRADEEKIKQYENEILENKRQVEKIKQESLQKIQALRAEELSLAKLEAKERVESFKAKLDNQYEQHLIALNDSKKELEEQLNAQLDDISTKLELSLKKL